MHEWLSLSIYIIYMIEIPPWIGVQCWKIPWDTLTAYQHEYHCFKTWIDIPCANVIYEITWQWKLRKNFEFTALRENRKPFILNLATRSTFTTLQNCDSVFHFLLCKKISRTLVIKIDDRTFILTRGEGKSFFLLIVVSEIPGVAPPTPCSICLT